jgi:formate dehydrogenase alpha subunit
MAPTTIDTVRLTIDGIALSVPKGTYVIEAARQAGVMIPHFCYHPKLTPDANCRMCLVEIEKVPKLQTSCSTPVTEGMVVRTATTVVNDAHKSVLEFILANHPLDCPVCDQGGRCDLQDFSHEYTPTTSRFVEVKRVFQKEYFSPLIEKQMNRCVQCLRCVRYCDEVMDVKALAPINRGTMTEITHFKNQDLDCEFCGGCIQICPVGAITSRLSMYEYRPWMLKRTDTTCTYCGDGCQLTIQTKDNQLIEVMSAHGTGRNNGDLCARGYFGYHVSTHPDRLLHPLVRKDGQLVQTTWEEALEFVAERTAQLKLAHGANAFAGLIGSRCTNEELYFFQKFLRTVIGTNKIDSSARYGHVNAVTALQRVQGTSRWTLTFEDIAAAEALLLVGTNITETNPITGLRVKEAVKKHGASLITLEALEPAIGTISNIASLSTHHLSLHPEQMAMAVLGLIKAVCEDGLIDSALRQRAPTYVQKLSERVGRLSWQDLLANTGVAQEAFREAAATFARASRGVILVGQIALRTPGASGLATNLLDLLLLTGHHGRPGSGLAPLAEENNEQGAIEMGTTAGFLPGAALLTDIEARDRIASAWKDNIPSGDSRSLLDILEDARTGAVKALFVVGDNPIGSLPPQAHTQEALEKLDLLVCQELFLTETAALAHVVFPACSYAEKNGTFTSTEGHVQAVRQAIDPVGESLADWEILSALSILLGHPLEYADAKEILREIRSLIPNYGQLGPAPTPATINRQAVEAYLTGGFEADLDQRYTVSATQATSDHEPFTLLLSQSLFHSGKLSTFAKGLRQIAPAGSLAMHPLDAAPLGIAEGDPVRVSNAQGSLQTTVKLLERIPRKLVVFPEHFDQDARRLMTVTRDASTGVPYCKSTQVTIARATT